MKIHERLRAIRKHHGYTQQHVADYLGLDRTTYTYYETGTICPSVETCLRLSDLYAISIAYIVCQTDVPMLINAENVLPDVAENFSFAETLTRKEKELIMFFRGMDDKKKDQLLKRLNPNTKRKSVRK